MGQHRRDRVSPLDDHHRIVVEQFRQTVPRYMDRHQEKGGMTGWAQVNGLRGDTTGEDKMRKRVEHDLWYIDNWSPLLDLRILWLTVFSRKAYRNAV